MIAAEREREKTRLALYRDLAERLAGDSWGLEVEGGETRVVSQRSTGESVCLCTIHADALGHEYELISGADGLLSLFLTLQDRAAAKVRALAAELEQGRRKNTPLAARAAMLCQDERFQRFLETRGAGGAVRDKQAADTRLKSLLAISSKTELNEAGDAQRKYFKLLDDYRAWKFGAGR